MATEKRPCTPRYEPGEWYTRNYTTSTTSEQSRQTANNTRQEMRFLRNETDSAARWDQYKNLNLLAGHIDKVRQIKKRSELTLEALNREIPAMSEGKELIENALEQNKLATDIATDCLTLRDTRRGHDVVDNGVEKNLNKELELNAAIKREMQNLSTEGFDQLTKMQRTRQRVVGDLQDKTIALDIDVDQYNLTDTSSGISFKPDPLRIPKGSSTIEESEATTSANQNAADQDIIDGLKLTERIHHTIHRTDNDMAEQQEATDYALRIRCHENENAISDLEWQKKETQKQIDEMVNEIRNMEQGLKDKVNYNKRAQTVLENRTYRPNLELCRDKPQFGLTDEVLNLEAAKKALEDKIKHGQHCLDDLQKNMHRINDELTEKRNSLKIDKQCQDMRLKLHKKPLNEFQKKHEYTGFERRRFEMPVPKYNF